jgi:endoglucanase
MKTRRVFILLILVVSVWSCGFAQSNLSQPPVSSRTVCSSSSEPAYPLHTVDRWIVDANGQRVKLHGVSWYGTESTDFVVAGLQLADLHLIAQRIRCMGFNVIRLPWSNQMYESNPIVGDYALTANPELQGMHALDIFDRVVQSLTDEGLMVILDNHNSNAEFCCGNDGNTLWYNAQYPQSSWIADWQGMTRRYINNPRVIGTDLRNEPRINATWGGSPSTDWHAAAQLGGNAVLQVNPALLIIVEGVNYALDLTGVANLPVQLSAPNRLVYSAHDYSFDHHGLQSYTDLEQELNHNWGYILTPGHTYTAPVWVGEFGNCHTQSICISDNSPGSGGFWFQSFRAYLAQYDIDWAYWAVNGTESTGSRRVYGSEETYGVLNPYWDAPVVPSELDPFPVLNTLETLQSVMQPIQGPGLQEDYPPSVALTSPLPGSIFMLNSPIRISADASLRTDSPDRITSVDFFANQKKLGSVTTPPYTFTWNNARPGQYAVSALVHTSKRADSAQSSQPISINVVDYAAHKMHYGQSISINFVGKTIPMSPTEIAGIVPLSNWNQANGNSGTLPQLMNEQGVATSTIVQWTSHNTYYLNIPDTPGNFRMMRGYQDNTNTVPTTIEVSGLPHSMHRFNVVIYFDDANTAADGICCGGATRSSNCRIQTTLNGKSLSGCGEPLKEGTIISGVDFKTANFIGIFTQTSGDANGNYVVFPDCVGDGFRLLPVHGGSTDSYYRAPVNGMQILSVPWIEVQAIMRNTPGGPVITGNTYGNRVPIDVDSGIYRLVDTVKKIIIVSGSFHLEKNGAFAVPVREKIPPGSYQLTVEVADGNGRSGSTTQTVTFP